ncbi:hypothetical protein Bbelb_015220 [Branchiostoma belcheri]|nr:hypothetical protein Bbelb_015220 [Branchiostoma belcheri]
MADAQAAQLTEVDVDLVITSVLDDLDGISSLKNEQKDALNNFVRDVLGVLPVKKRTHREKEHSREDLCLQNNKHHLNNAGAPLAIASEAQPIKQREVVLRRTYRLELKSGVGISEHLPVDPARRRSRDSSAKPTNMSRPRAQNPGFVSKVKEKPGLSA